MKKLKLAALYLCHTFLLTTLCLLTPTAQAAIEAHPLAIDIDGKPFVRSLQVKNTSAHKAYVQATVTMITHPGGKEKRTLVKDPRVAGLIVTPSKFVLAPGKTRYLRVALTEPPGEKDRVYMINVMPVAQHFTSKHSGARFIVGTGVWLHVRALNPEPHLFVTRKAGQLLITNRGNSYAVMDKVRVCTKAKCKPVPRVRHHIYAGNRLSFAVPHGSELRFVERIGKQHKEVTITN